MMATLCAVLAVSLLAGCNGKKNTASVGATGEVVRDLGGMEIVIGNWWGDYDVNTFKPATADDEKILAWRTEIQKKYNFTMTEKNIGGWGEIQQIASTSIMAGSPAASVFILATDWAMSLYTQGLLYPVSDLPSVDFSSTTPVEWNQNVREAFTAPNGKTYAWAVGYNLGGGVYWNKRLFEEAGLDKDLPYNLQKSGEWTWDAYMALCKRLTRDTNSDGIIDVYGLAADGGILDYAVSSNNARFVDKDVNGRFFNSSTSSGFLQALQYVYSFKGEGVLMMAPPQSNWDWFMSAFHDGQVAMRVAAQYVSGDLRDMQDDWGFVVFPRGPGATTYRYHVGENIQAVPVTFSAEEADNIMFAYSLWTTNPNPGGPDAWKESMYPSYRDARAIDETIQLMHEDGHSMFDYGYLIPGIERGDISWHMWSDGDDPRDAMQPAQLIESVSQSWSATIDLVNPK
ncbi:hypothetical protein FACS189493_2880 [Spirochaetia bacterium]|nr:hypothetical protein FACS189493_2880 [Spirochaetia bacterium]